MTDELLFKCFPTFSHHNQHPIAGVMFCFSLLENAHGMLDNIDEAI